MPNCLPPLSNFWKFFQPPAPIRAHRISVFAKKFSKMFQTDFLSKSSGLLATFLCLDSHDHRRPIYEHRVLRSSIILDFTAFVTPSPCLSISSDVSIPLRIFRPPAMGHLRGITTGKNFFYIEQDINLKLCIYTDFDMLSTNLKIYFGCGFSFPWKQ